MTFRLRVLQVQSAAKRFQRIVVRLLQLRMLRGELRRTLFHQLLKIPLIRAILHHQPAMLQRPPNTKKELILLKRLQDVVVCPAANRFQRRRDIVDRRHHNDRHFGVVLAQPVQQLDAIHLRHDHVAQNKVWRHPLDLVLRGPAVADGGALVPLRFEHRRNDLSNCLFVVYDQYVFRVHYGWLPGVIIRDGTALSGGACPVRK